MEVSITHQDFCSYCFLYSYKIHNSFNCKNSNDKIAENTLDDISKLKNIPNERLRCPTKSLLKWNFWTISNLSKTPILHHVIILVHIHKMLHNFLESFIPFLSKSFLLFYLFPLLRKCHSPM